jgi:hypothetical protein
MNEIENTCKTQMEVLQAFSILNPILYDRIPIEKIDLNIFSDFNDLIKNKERNSEIFSAELDLEKIRLKINLQMMDIYLKAGKREFGKDKYSYRGIIYDIEKIKKAPATSDETEKFKNMAKDLHELYEQKRNLENGKK